MKNKLIVSIFVLFGLFILTVGCSKKNQVVCTINIAEEDDSFTEEGVFELDDNDIVIKASGTFTFSSEDLANTYCNVFKMGIMEEYANLVSCSGNKVMINDLDKISGEEDELTKLVGMSKEELIKLETEEGYTCK